MIDDQVAERISENADWPPMMDWRAFAEWIRVDESIVHIPSLKVGRRRMVNLVQLVEKLKEGEE